MKRRDELADSDAPEEENPLRDLMCGLAPKHVRFLCECAFNGGFGFRPDDVGNMTLDEAFMLLCDKNVLRVGKHRILKMDAPSVSSVFSSDGTLKGRTKDGTQFTAKAGGKSLTQIIMEREAAAKKAETSNADVDVTSPPKESGRRRRRRRRG